jgi:hypothetical protein
MGVKVQIGVTSVGTTLMILGYSAHDNDSSIRGGLYHCRLRTVTSAFRFYKKMLNKFVSSLYFKNKYRFIMVINLKKSFQFCSILLHSH